MAQVEEQSQLTGVDAYGLDFVNSSQTTGAQDQGIALGVASQNASANDQAVVVNQGSRLVNGLDLGSGLTVGDNGTVTLTTNDPAVAEKALELAKSQNEAVLEALTNLSSQSNESAQLVTTSQEKFVETASGQKWVVWAVIGLGAIISIAFIKIFSRHD